MSIKKLTPNKRNQRVQKCSIRKHRVTKLNLHSEMVEANLTITVVEVVQGKTVRYKAAASKSPSTFSFVRKATEADCEEMAKIYSRANTTNMAVFVCRQNNKLYLAPYKTSEQPKKAA